jgi:hypothetical membrane protein
MPMVSDLVCLHMWDRVFILLTTCYIFACHQVNVRAFYKMLYGIASHKTNDFLLILGYLSCISLPCIGIFDEHDHMPMHIVCTILFFTPLAFYAFFVAKIMYKNKDKFPNDNGNIHRLLWISYFMLALAIGFGVSVGLKGPFYWTTPILEWITVLMAVNFFTFTSFSNPYYDSIHPYGKLISPTTTTTSSTSLHP